MQMTKVKFILSLLGAFMLGIVLMGGVSAYRLAGTGSVSEAGIDANKLAEINKYIKGYYLNDDYDNSDLAEGAYKGYVAGLKDPYSAYMDKKEYETWMTSTTGEYSGVGITFSADEDGNFVVISVAKNSPAAKAGFEAGDILLMVDGETYEDMDLMASDIRGKKGTEVTISYARKGKVEEVTLVRDNIVQESVDYKMLDSDTGYIEISSFIENTSEDFDSALKAVEKKGAKDLILDLRNNGGGLVDECVEIADQFLDEGVVCYVEDKNGKSDTYDAEDGKTDLNTVVLVNENSASASEILSAAMKDNGYKIIGTNTFGKGVIQTTIDFDDGSGLKLTIMQYLSPDKHVIHKKGIKPDYEVEDNEDTDDDEQLDKAKEILQK